MTSQNMTSNLLELLI